MSGDRHWMYSRLNVDDTINKDFVDGVETFVDFACNHSGMTSANEIRCPCKKCRNRKFQELDEVRIHLFRKGFVEDYYQWDRHGEQYLSINFEHSQDNVSVDEGMESTCPYRQMILDAAGPEFQAVAMEEAPNMNAQKFYDMLKTADEKLGCTKHTQMSVVARLLHMKSEHHFLERCFDDFTQLLQEVFSEDNKMVANFYRTKKLVQDLGLPVEKIDCCKNNCMIYWDVDNDLTSCKFCNHSRFKSRRDSGKNVPHKIMYYFPLSPRLQRLYASEATAAHM